MWRMTFHSFWQLPELVHFGDIVRASALALLPVHQLEEKFVVAMNVSMGRSGVVHLWKGVPLRHWLVVQAVAHHLHVESIRLAQGVELLLPLLVEDAFVYAGMAFGDVTSIGVLEHGEVVFRVWTGAFFLSPWCIEESLWARVVGSRWPGALGTQHGHYSAKILVVRLLAAQKAA
jgi:hypothetical protein